MGKRVRVRGKKGGLYEKVKNEVARGRGRKKNIEKKNKDNFQNKKDPGQKGPWSKRTPVKKDPGQKGPWSKRTLVNYILYDLADLLKKR